MPTVAHARTLSAADIDDVARIDALHTGAPTRANWERVFADFLDPRAPRSTFGFGVEGDGRLVGYLFGEVRAVEFGSEPCGWVFAVGIETAFLRRGFASVLLDAAMRRFRDAGVATVRTMVKRNDVPVLSFFRAHGFVGGSYVQLELDLEEDVS